MNDYAAMNETCMAVGSEYNPKHLTLIDIATIPDPKPARTCVTVADLGKGANVNHLSRLDGIASCNMQESHRSRHVLLTDTMRVCANTLSEAKAVRSFSTTEPACVYLRILRARTCGHLGSTNR